MPKYTVYITHLGYRSGRAASYNTKEEAICIAIEMSSIHFVKASVMSPDGVTIAEYQNKRLVKGG